MATVQELAEKIVEKTHSQIEDLGSVAFIRKPHEFNESYMKSILSTSPKEFGIKKMNYPKHYKNKRRK